MDHHKSLSEINVVPFCDVLLVLLIIFMVTAPLLQQGLDVNLPQANAPQITHQKSDIILSMRKDGTIYLGEEPTTIAFLEERLGDVFKARERKDLFIKADADIRYGEVVRIMSIAKTAGVVRIGMITQPEKK